MLIHFVRNGPSYLPELDAYAEFLHTRGHQALIHDDSHSVPSSASVVWWICGRVPHQEAHRLRQAFQVHEYASASVPPHPWLKDCVKRWTQPRPDFRIYQNGWVRERLGLETGWMDQLHGRVPSALRDMGVAPHFFEVAKRQDLPAPEFDLVYLGEMGRLLPFVPMLHSIHGAGRRLLLVGEVPEALQALLPESVHCVGRVPHAQVPLQLRRARYGLNLVSNITPYNQQTSTKLLEYCAVGLPVVSNDYAWVRYFAAEHQGNFLLLRDEPESWQTNFGEALDAFPYTVPQIDGLAWSQVLAKLPLWRHLLGE